MRPQSCKAKGRRLQQCVAVDLQRAFSLDADDVRSTSMGANGEDVLLSASARDKFPFSVECKNTERLNLWESWSQAKTNAGAHAPLLVVHKNNSDTLCVVKWKVFLELAQRPPAGSEEVALPPAVEETTATTASAASTATGVCDDAGVATIRLSGGEGDAQALARSLRGIAARLEAGSVDARGA